MASRSRGRSRGRRTASRVVNRIVQLVQRVKLKLNVYLIYGLRDVLQETAYVYWHYVRCRFFESVFLLDWHYYGLFNFCNNIFVGIVNIIIRIPVFIITGFFYNITLTFSQIVFDKEFVP